MLSPFTATNLSPNAKLISDENDRHLICMFSFTGDNDNDLSFRSGEELYLLDSNHVIHRSLLYDIDDFLILLYLHFVYIV
ncbi:hypothetical protein GJ496_010422 [Pomphorhynchus laevis]|nr:hypothetical protein GJ496_010422 [Pomphorhynchus laevis]